MFLIAMLGCNVLELLKGRMKTGINFALNENLYYNLAYEHGSRD
jgi:hypothetical protein